MTRLPISGCTIIRDAVQGAFCLFESMAMMLPVVDDVHVMDMGSMDNTLELLREIAAANERVYIHSKTYPWETALILAEAQNDVVALAHHDKVLLWQADEIWHEKLLANMRGMFERGIYDLMFWRYQLHNNFKTMYWRPVWVHRAGDRRDGRLHFDGDGMNTAKRVDVKPCPDSHAGPWMQWNDVDPLTMPLADMILDVTWHAFRDNAVQRRRLHHPLWGQSVFTIEGPTPEDWQQEADANPIWTQDTTPFDIPKIMRYHVGKTLYEVRPELLDALKEDVAGEYLDGI